MQFRSKFMAMTGVLMFSALPAIAADMPARPAYKAASVVAPAFNWTGFYLGLNGGFAFGAGDGDGGGIFGGTIGYNYQAPGSWIVFGIEGDAGWTNYGNSITATSGALTVTASAEAQAVATLRGRIGAAFDRSLVYVTGGGAWLRNEVSVSATAGGFTVGASDSQNHFGYAVGAGIEHAFAPNWSAKLEYIYLGLGSETYFSSIGGGIASGELNAHTIKAGINYRF